MVSITTTEECVLTGVKEMDEELSGGIPTGSLVFIEGQSQSGKSILTQYLAYGALQSSGSAVSYYTTESGVKHLIDKMDSLSLDTLHYFLADCFRIYPLDLYTTSREIQESIRLLIDHISKLPERFNLVIVDAITPIMVKINPMSTLDFFHACKELCNQSRTIILVADPHGFRKGILSRARLVSDTYMRIRSEYQRINAEKIGDRPIRILDVQKLHGVERPQREGIKFEIQPETGIKVLPFAEAKI